MSYPKELRDEMLRGRCILSGRPGKARIKKVSLRKESEREPNDLVELKENGSRRLPATKVWKEAQ